VVWQPELPQTQSKIHWRQWPETGYRRIGLKSVRTDVLTEQPGHFFNFPVLWVFNPGNFVMAIYGIICMICQILK